MALRGKKPEKLSKRLKMFAYGSAGVGKTTAFLQFPNSYIIDTEHGTDGYDELINKSNSVVFNSVNVDEIIDEIKSLMTEPHPYKTLIIDPVTTIYNSIQEKWTDIFTKYAKTEQDREVQDFGMRFWGKVKSDYKKMQRLLLRLDMNVIVSAHQKDVYGNNFSKIGVTFDSMRGDDYFFDLIFRILRSGDKLTAVTEKERAIIGKHKFPPEFEWSYNNFLQLYGKDIIERDAEIIDIITVEKLTKLNKLVNLLKIEDVQINKWLDKCDVRTFDELTVEQGDKLITALEKEINYE